MTRRKRSTIRQGTWRPVLAYGTALAAGAGVLQWLEYRQVMRVHSGEVQFALVAALFLALGIWAGMQLVGGRTAATVDDGNPAARATLGISEREHEVLALLAEGLSNKEIAGRLGVSPNTVKTHVARLLEKLEARRRTEAILKARQLGLIG